MISDCDTISRDFTTARPLTHARTHFIRASQESWWNQRPSLSRLVQDDSYTCLMVLVMLISRERESARITLKDQ
jgi:hypothetical protein